MEGFDVQQASRMLLRHRDDLDLLAEEGWSKSVLMTCIGYMMEYDGCDSPFAVVHMVLAAEEGDFSLNTNPTGWDYIEGNDRYWRVSHSSRVVIETPYGDSPTVTSVYAVDETDWLIQKVSGIMARSDVNLVETARCGGGGGAICVLPLAGTQPGSGLTQTGT